jgi:nicotinamidase-related amidase
LDAAIHVDILNRWCELKTRLADVHVHKVPTSLIGAEKAITTVSVKLFGMKSKIALLVIDMQLVAFDGVITPAITNGDRVLEQVSQTIHTIRSNNLPIIFIQTCALDGQPYAKDTHGWEIHPSISVKPEDRVVFKPGCSGFDDTTLEQILRELKIKSVITCGIWSEYCVTETSLSALRLGFEVCLVADAHGTVADSEQDAEETICKQQCCLSIR